MRSSFGSPSLSRLCGCLIAVSLTACNGTVDESADQAPDEVTASAIVGPITWDAKSLMKQITSSHGCDSWIPTWAADGNLYTEYGDCRPKGVPQKIGMGFGRISGSAAYSVTFAMVPTGDPLDWDDAANGAGAEAIGDGPDSEKPAGMLFVDGRLYNWIRNIAPGAGTGIRLKYSDDYSSSNPQFTWVDWDIPEVGYSSFVQYGQAYAGGPADYVYSIIPMRSTTVGDVSNSAYDLIPAFTLMRGLRSNLTAQSSWEFFCGTSSTPAWCPTSSSARHILYKSGKKFTARAGMDWNPGINKFMLTLVYDPTPATTGDSPRFYGGLMVLISGHPWGPWTMVFNSGKTWPGGPSTTGCGKTNWGAGERAEIPSKYMSADGKTFYLFSSGGDCLSIARGRLP
jgi:hypothetical protein